MRYSKSDFKKEKPTLKPLFLKLSHDDHAALKGNAKVLGVTMQSLIMRCLRDAGALNVKPKEGEEEEDDLEPLLSLGR